MNRLICEVCGSPLSKKSDGAYECRVCGSIYEDNSADKQAEIIASILNEQKQENLASLRRLLFDAIHQQYPSSEEILSICGDIRRIYPEDPLATFFEVANANAVTRLNSYLASTHVSPVIAKEVMAWMQRSMEARSIASLKEFVAHHYRDEEAAYYLSQIEAEAERLDSGIYVTTLPRDVFVAYSSQDGKRVLEIVDFLEGEGFSCFLASRNLRHGKGAAENYLRLLKEAMHHCKCVVFLSSNASRQLSCDALDVELPYIKENEPEMGRIEFLLEEYAPNTPLSVKMTLKDFFAGLEWCRTKEDLVARILSFRRKREKTCPNCGAKNVLSARFCSNCSAPLDEKDAPRVSFVDEPEEEEEKQEPLFGKIALKPKSGKTSGKRFSGADYTPAGSATPSTDFEIVAGTAKAYKGSAKKVVIPKGVTSLSGTFKNNKTIVSVVVPYGVTEIEGAFEGCASLQQIQLPESLVRIGPKSFMACSALTEVVLPSSLKSIGDNGFANSGLAHLTIPFGVSSISKNAFYGVNKCQFSIEENNAYYRFSHGCLISKQENSVLFATNELFVPDGVEIIEEDAYSGIRGNYVSLPDSVRIIKERAFSSCGLVEASINSNIEIMGKDAFANNGDWKGEMTIYLAMKKPLFGLPKGFDKQWCPDKAKVVWSNKRG